MFDPKRIFRKRDDASSTETPAIPASPFLDPESADITLPDGGSPAEMARAITALAQELGMSASSGEAQGEQRHPDGSTIYLLREVVDCLDWTSARDYSVPRPGQADDQVLVVSLQSLVDSGRLETSPNGDISISDGGVLSILDPRNFYAIKFADESVQIWNDCGNDQYSVWFD